MEGATADLKDVFKALKDVIEPYTAGLGRKTDSDTELYLECPKPDKPMFFGAVQQKKNHVSYHLMPVYTDPDLLEAISPELRGRMRGKSCFDFKAVDPVLFSELAALTEVGLERCKQHGYV